MDELQTVLDRLDDWRPGHALPGVFYGDPVVHRVDLETIWYRDWLFVAHASSLPGAGDYLTVRVGDASILLVRDGDGRIRAMHNVCRHRGSLLCEGSGHATRRIVCPYHQWSYAFDGSLTGAPRSGPTIDRERHGLMPVACEVVHGMVFISLAQEPPPFTGVRDLFGSHLAPFDLQDARVVASVTIVEEGNWKLVLENNRECYHCSGAHPELAVTFPLTAMHSGSTAGPDAQALAELVERCEAAGLPSAFRATPDFQTRVMRLPLAHGAVSMTMTGQPGVAARFPGLPAEGDLGDVLAYHYPSTWNHAMADHALTFSVLPLGPTSTQVTTHWLVPPHAVEGVDYDVADLTSVWRATNEQDRILVERTQRGVRSPAFRPGPLAPVEEDGVAQFLEWYTTTVPARLRARGGSGRPPAPAAVP